MNSSIDLPLPRLRNDVEVQLLGDSVQFCSKTRGIRVSGSRETCVDILTALNLRGQLANHARTVAVREQAEVVRALFREGLALDERSPITNEGCSGWNFLGELVEHVDTTLQERFLSHSVLNGLVEGSEPAPVAAGWLLENFLFTSSAEFHIAPLTERVGEKRKRWSNFLEEERNHWRLYSALFSELGWRLEVRRKMSPLSSTLTFISLLREFAEHDELSYAAALMITEQPPDVDDLECDPLFGSMCRNYKYAHGSINPLFRHVCENGRNGHSDLPTQVFSEISWVPRSEARKVLASVSRLAEVLQHWYAEIGAFYGTSPDATYRLSRDA